MRRLSNIRQYLRAVFARSAKFLFIAISNIALKSLAAFYTM